MKTHAPKSNSEPIAIVGMSCRFPHADSLKQFWELLKEGKETVAEISKDRWDADKYYDPDHSAERKTHQRHASLLKNIHSFDPLFFNISPAEAIEMSPSQKLMLELAWEAMENATIPFNALQGKNVGVFVGNIWNDFEHYRKFKNARATLHSAVGMSANVIANRVSFAFGFTGPSLVLDTGCSASLVALHLACQSLENKESEMAIVGGINHILDPDKYIELTRFGGLSQKGRCSTFDEEADGFVRGEGGGALLLKRLSEAEKDGDKIYAIIRGTAVNNNGFNDTLPATSIEGQKTLLEKAYSRAGIKPHEVHYVEAHGTGTKLGDPNEARALGEFFREGRNGKHLRIGSVKTNIGHTEATAGIAGLIKVALAMQHKMLPPNLNFNTPSASIPFDELKLEVQHSLTHWPANDTETLKAGINSFGWGGTNAHAILEEYVPSEKGEPYAFAGYEGRYVLPLATKSPQALQHYAKDFAKLLEASDTNTFNKTCIATALLKPGFDHRKIFSGNDPQEMLAALHTFIEDGTEVAPHKLLTENDKVVFVFPGQGSQWIGMGRTLFKKEKVFRDTLKACDAAFKPYTDWSLLDEIHATPETSRLQEINVIQPALCAVQIALARLWMSWGIQPHAVVGHSMGEVAAAHVAGILSLEDAARVICLRSRLMRTVSGKGGAMAVTELPCAEAEKLAETYKGKLSVAVNNSPKSTVLAGDQSSIERVLAELEGRGLFCRQVKVDVASHSPQMDPLKEPLRDGLNALRPQKSSIPFISTVLNQEMDGSEMGADYWVKNLRGTVQFSAVMERLMREQHVVFIETSPHPVLVNAVNECAEFSRKKVVTISSLYRDLPEQEELFKNLGELYANGYSIDWGTFYGITQAPGVYLPPYPFQRESYEIEDLTHQLDTVDEAAVRFPLLGRKISLAGDRQTYYWESSISLSKFPFLKDHLIHDSIEVPSACYLAIAFESVADIFGPAAGVCIKDMCFIQPIYLAETARLDWQVKLTMQEAEAGIIHIYKKEHNADEQQWILLAEGILQITLADLPVENVFETIEHLEPTYTEGISYYNMLRSVGHHYGNYFQQLTGLNKIGHQSGNAILFSIKPHQSVCQTSGRHQIHPAFISSTFQPVLGQLAHVLEEGHILNVHFTGIEQAELLGSVNYERELRGLMVFHPLESVPDQPNTWRFTADIMVANHDNTPVMRITNLRGTGAGKAVSKEILDHQDGDFPFLNIYREMRDEAEKKKALESILIHLVSKITKTAPGRIRTTMTFKNLGIDSLMAVQLRNQLELEFKMKLPVGMFWKHPSIEDYAHYLCDRVAEQANGTASGTSAKTSAANTWFVIPKPNKAAPFRLFCFHDAGGSASLFSGWEELLEESMFEVVQVEMPGRGRRLEETAYTHLEPLLEDLVPQITTMLDKPYIFLGHSMGGLIAFEVIRALRHKNLRLPQKLFISSTSGLTAYDKKQVDYRLSDEALIEEYPHLALAQIGDPEMQQLMTRMLRADLELLYNYEYKAEALLDMPITAIHGAQDTRVKRHQIEQWEKETTASFTLISRQGGHSYIQQDGTFVAMLIQEDIYSIMEIVSVQSRDKSGLLTH